MDAPILITTMGPMTSVLAEFYSDLLANEKPFLLHEDQEGQISFFQQDLGECLLFVGLRNVSFIANL